MLISDILLVVRLHSCQLAALAVCDHSGPCQAEGTSEAGSLALRLQHTATGPYLLIIGIAATQRPPQISSPFSSQDVISNQTG